MDNAEPETGTHSRDPIPAEKESVESIEDLLRRFGFFDSVVPDEKDEEALAS